MDSKDIKCTPRPFGDRASAIDAKALAHQSGSWVTGNALTVIPNALQTLGYQNMPLDDAANLSQHAEGQQELMQTEDENRLLRHRLNTHRDQATGIESSLAEVAQLTEVFTQQVMQQSEQIELLYTEVSLACVTGCCCANKDTAHMTGAERYGRHATCKCTTKSGGVVHPFTLVMA